MILFFRHFCWTILWRWMGVWRILKRDELPLFFAKHS